MRTARLSLSLGSLVAAALLAGCTPRAAAPEPTESSVSSSAAMQESMQPEHILVTAEDIVWSDAPASLPAGAKVAVLEGDPSKAGPFTIRLQFPANYRIAPHYHPADEHVTILSGSFSLGMGETFDAQALTELSINDFAMMRTGTRHFAWSRSGAVIQLHGVGPWGLVYVNPADDPRNATK